MTGTEQRWFRRAELWPPGSLLLLVLAFLVLAYAGYQWLAPKPPAKPDATWTHIQQEGVLRIGIDPSFPPFERDDGHGNLSGLDIALAQELGKRWNVKVQFVYSGFDGLYDALNGNQFDVILSALPYNPDKTQDVYFTHSYFNGGPILVVRSNDSTGDLSQLLGQSVAVELGSSGDTVARKWERRLQLNLIESNTTEDALRAVQDDRATAALVDPISLYDFQKTSGETLKQVGQPLADELYVMAVRRDSPTLLQQINAAIDTWQLDGTLEQLQKQWF